MQCQTAALVQSAESCARAQPNSDRVLPLSSYRLRKEKLAHKRQQALGIQEGLIGVWSCKEMGKTYRAYFDRGAKMPALRHYNVPLKHLYFYFDHADHGFMNVRLQTWFPYHIQICMNGREWLRRSLENESIGHLREKNKFLDIDNYPRAQELLNSQLDHRWPEALDSFLPVVFPTMHSAVGDMRYYWTLWQSEWATDIIFHKPEQIKPHINALCRHAFLSGTSERVMTYLGHRLTKSANPYPNFKKDVVTRVNGFHDGARVRHWVGKNSVKVYNEYNVLRVETTVNDPGAFKVLRHTSGDAPDAPKQIRPLRKGIVDIPLRAAVSGDVNNRFLDNLTQFSDPEPVGELFDTVARRFKRDGRSVRALDLFGKDHEFLKLLADPNIEINGISNKELRQGLSKTRWGKGKTDKQLSAKISRQFRLLRDHGLLRKQPGRHRYNLTSRGRKLMLSLSSIPACSVEKLMEIAA